MTPSSSSGSWLRARLVVLSDRRPAPGAPRRGLESAIEWALREHDGIWLGHGEAAGDAGAGALEGGASMEAWAGYVRANASYAERIIEVVHPDGMVWIHGDRWLLVASALRDHGHRGPIGLSLDAPFPAPSRLEALPWYVDLMAALGRLDLIRLRAPEDAAHFEACRVRAGRHRPSIAILPDDPPADRGAPPTWTAELLRRLGAAAQREPRRGVLE